MAPSFPEADARYFGFTDLDGYKDFVVYVYSCAPDMFPEEDWRKPDEQMDLDRAFAGLRYGLDLTAKQKGESVILSQCRELVEAAYSSYKLGREHEGQLNLEEVEKRLKKIPSR